MGGRTLRMQTGRQRLRLPRLVAAANPFQESDGSRPASAASSRAVLVLGFGLRIRDSPSGIRDRGSSVGLSNSSRTCRCLIAFGSAVEGAEDENETATALFEEMLAQVLLPHLFALTIGSFLLACGNRRLLSLRFYGLMLNIHDDHMMNIHGDAPIVWCSLLRFFI